MTIFLAQRSPERFGMVLQASRTVRNGSADLNFARRYFCTASKPPKKAVKSSSSCFAFSKPSKEPACGSKGQGYKRKESEKRQREGNFSAYSKSLNRQCKGMLSTREKVKLDVDYKRLEVSQLFVHGRRGSFQNLTCLENCFVESFLTKSYNCVVCIEMYPFESIACVESSLLMVLVFVYFFKLCVLKLNNYIVKLCYYTS